ncbi:unnamed protein product [Rhodiola kirilowii]
MEDFTGQKAGQAILCPLVAMEKSWLLVMLLVAVLLCICCETKCTKGCHLALASYYIWPGSNITFISHVMATTPAQILAYNSDKVRDKDNISSGIRINVPFTCDCIGGKFLGHVFEYSVQPGDYYSLIAETYYSNLATYEWLEKFNSYPEDDIPDTNAVINVTVNCSCGDSSISKDYGLFITYPLMETDTPESIANESGISQDLFSRYNPNADFAAGSGLVYIPGKDLTGKFVALRSSAGLELKVIVGIAVASSIGAFIIGLFTYYGFFRKKITSTTFDSAKDYPATASDKAESFGVITIDKSVEFTYGELAKATNNFSLSHKIGQGGFATVYYAELRGQKAAIKKMDVQSSKQFLVELKVLTHVHHTNLVRLIGFCVESSLFLIYEFLENGNLNELLHNSEREPLSWCTRVQIALDSARGLEYIHEHTVPGYIHLDIKSANILIDKNFRGKIADFGLTKLAEESGCRPSGHLAGTFGYMPPEYARDGLVSPKVDVFAFGVVLYELLSGKNSVIKTNESTIAMGLAAMFDDVLNKIDSKEDLCKVMDPLLGDNYPLEAAFQMAQIAKACTQHDRLLRPGMKSVVVTLMALTSDEDPDVTL